MRLGAGRPATAGMLLVAALAAWGCAKREPPGGGPPDLTPPLVVASAPDSGAANVRLTGPLAVTFSEGMEPRSAGDAVALAPYVDFRRRRWHGRTLFLDPADSLRPNQVYTLFVGSGARDRHGNTMGSGAAVVFTTGDSFPRGRIAGEIEAHGFAAPGTYIWCYAADRPGPDSTARDFDALGQVDREGRFRVDGLRVPGRFRLWAFADLNNNHSFEPSSDVLARVDTTIEITPEHPVASGLRIRVVSPRAPARVRGTVLDSLVDSVGVARLIAVSGQDSTRRVTVDADAKGAFDLALDPGPWVLRAYGDLDGSKTWQPDKEPASDPLPLTLAPADDLVEVRLVLRPPRAGPAER
jgi:hypothetical protein